MLAIERITINPVSEDPTLAALDLVGLDPSWGIYLMEHDYPPPELDTQRTGNADTEGDRVVQSRYQNRTLMAKLRLFEPEDPAGTNLVTNPSFELGLDGWAAAGTPATRERVADEDARRGDAVQEVVTDGANEGAVTVPSLATDVSTDYTASAWVKAGAGTDLTLRVEERTAADAAVGSTDASIEASGEWERITVTRAFGGTGAKARVRVFAPDAASTFRFDAVQLEAGDAATAYQDGDTPGCSWTGARHASASTRPAPDGTRFSHIARDVTRMLDRITREKRGFYRRISALGPAITYDLRSARITEAPQDLGVQRRRAEIRLAFEALPFGRGEEVLAGESLEETLPVNVFTIADIEGDVPALGRLILEDTQGVNQAVAWWGLQSETYDAASTAAPFYQAEALTPLGEASKGALAGASGGEAIRHLNLVNGYQAVFSTQLNGGNHLTHVGSYRVLARVFRPTANTGAVSVLWSWAEGDFLDTTENHENAVEWAADESEGVFSVVDLGMVELSSDRWEGRLLAKSTVPGDDIYVDWLLLLPASEGSGSLRVGENLDPPTELAIADAFNQTPGAATGKTAEKGGVYAALPNSAATDYSISGGKLVRTAISDAGTMGTAGHFKGRAIGTPTELTSLVAINSFRLVGVAGFSFPGNIKTGQFLSYVNNTNFVHVQLYYTGSIVGWNLGVRRPNGTFIAWKEGAVPRPQPGGVDHIVEGKIMSVIVGNRLTVYLAEPGGDFRKMLVAEDPLIGVKGRFAIYDEHNSSTAITREYDDVQVWPPSIGAAVFANRTAEILHDRVRRRSADDSTWGKVSYEGDHLLVPQSGPEQRPSRIVTKLSRFPDIDAGIDDQRSTLYVTPRYLMAPPT